MPGDLQSAARGLVAFPITPMDAQGRIDVEAFARLLRRLEEARVDAICVLGSTGTYAYLTREERRRALVAAAAELGGRTPLMAGVGALRTDDAIAHARDAADAGAGLGLLAPMSYTPLTDDELCGHFEAVAAQGGLPICVYDNPAATHFAIGDDLMQRLAAISDVVACKSSAPPVDAAARVAALRARTPPGFSVGFSGDWNATAALIGGADAWYSVLAGLFPAPLVAIRRAVARGDAEEALRLSAALEPMWALMREHSGLRVMYAAADLAGVCGAAPPRPILPVTAPVREKIAAVLDLLGPTLGGDAPSSRYPAP